MTDENTRSELADKLSERFYSAQTTRDIHIKPSEVSEIIAALRQPDQNKTPVPELVERLMRSANISSDAEKKMSQAKSLRQGHNPPRDDLYSWPTPEQTIEYRAAAALTTLAAENERLREEDWQPIDTAPTDGTKFIAAKFVGHPDHESCFWWACTCSWSDKWQKWWDGIEPCGLAGPTHWRPAGRPALAKLDQAMGEG